jgi:hypothetical protein
MTSRFRKKRHRKLAVEQLEERRLMASLPFGATPDDTGEFLLGRIAVTPVFLESNGQLDPNTENWSPSSIQGALTNIKTGLDWWTNLLATKTTVHKLEWVIDTTYALNPTPTPYEPISRTSDNYSLWVPQFLGDVGFSASSSLFANMRDFNNAQRNKLNTDWAFTIFVVNSRNDGDGNFAPNGTFTRAFAFAGGQFEVVPSTRPASTYTHETGHMFWARDEYSGGGRYDQRRGYYNSQNTNAIDGNPNPTFQQELSIMSSGGNLQAAYDQLVTSDATLAQLGWVDSDGDGIFDVLDVPFKLEGTGRLNKSINQYRFVGKATVQTLPNRNTSGTQDDITLNKIEAIEYRIDGGSWTTVATPNQYVTNVDVSISILPNQQRIELRAIDRRTGVISNIFSGLLGNIPDTTTQTGIQGFAFNDVNNDNQFGATEVGFAGASVTIVDANAQPIVLQTKVEPDSFPVGLFNNQLSGVRLDVIGEDATGSLGIFADPNATTGTKVFRPYSATAKSFVEAFQGTGRQLRARFDNTTTYFAIDAVAVADGTDIRLDAFAADGSLVKRFDRRGLLAGQVAIMEIGTDSPQISYVTVRGMNGSFFKLDNLRYGPKNTATTASDGSYVLTNLPAGTYRLLVQPIVSGFQSSNPNGAIQTAVLTASGTIAHIDYGLYRPPSPWQNPRFAEDVNDQGTADPLDVLILINEINLNQSRPLDGTAQGVSPYLDVNGDRVLSPLDILQVINYINRRGSGEGETQASLFATSEPDPAQSDAMQSYFASYVNDFNINKPNTWIVDQGTSRNRVAETGVEKCGCPACTAFAPAGEFSPSILEIANASRNAKAMGTELPESESTVDSASDMGSASDNRSRLGESRI